MLVRCRRKPLFNELSQSVRPRKNLIDLYLILAYLSLIMKSRQTTSWWSILPRQTLERQTACMYLMYLFNTFALN